MGLPFYLNRRVAAVQLRTAWPQPFVQYFSQQGF